MGNAFHKTFNDEYDFCGDIVQRLQEQRPQTEEDCYTFAATLSQPIKQFLAPVFDDIPTTAATEQPEVVPSKTTTSGCQSQCIPEDRVQEELIKRGPVIAVFDMREDFTEHILSNKDEPYEPSRSSSIIGRHATTVIGYGTTYNGQGYWKCVDSNSKRVYRMMYGSLDMFWANNPLWHLVVCKLYEFPTAINENLPKDNQLFIAPVKYMYFKLNQVNITSSLCDFYQLLRT